jgi:hypothetical protein
MAEAVNKDVEIQAPWNCRRVRVGHRFVSIPEESQREGMWFCLRPPGPPRYVTEEECARCEFWEPEATAGN